MRKVGARGDSQKQGKEHGERRREAAGRKRRCGRGERMRVRERERKLRLREHRQGDHLVQREKRRRGGKMRGVYIGSDYLGCCGDAVTEVK